MRVLTTHSKANPLLKALANQSVQVDFIGWEELPSFTEWSGVSVFYGNIFDEIKTPFKLRRLTNKLHEARVPYLFWNRDAPWNTGITALSKYALKRLRPVDIYLTHSLQTDSLFGDHAFYFPNAAPLEFCLTEDFFETRSEYSYGYDVSFFGSFGKCRQEGAKRRSAFLLELEARLKRKIPDLRFIAVDTSKNKLSLADQISLIQRSKINIDFAAMCDLAGRPSKGLPERVFGIPAAAGLLLSDKGEMIRHTFKESDPLVFNDIDECERIILDILPNYPRQRALAEAVQRDVKKNHTYAIRSELFKKLVEAY